MRSKHISVFNIGEVGPGRLADECFLVAGFNADHGWNVLPARR